MDEAVIEALSGITLLQLELDQRRLSARKCDDKITPKEVNQEEKKAVSQVLDLYKGSRSDDWETPAVIYDALNQQYNFTTDLAANAKNAKTAKFYSVERSFLVEENMLATVIDDISWINPPFSLAEEFFAQVAKASRQGARIIGIFKSSNMETGTWQKYILPTANWILQPARRVNYVGAGKSAPFPSAIIGWNLDAPKYLSGTMTLGPFYKV